MKMIDHALRAWMQGFHIFPVNPCGTVDPETGHLIDKRPHLLYGGKPYTLRWGEVATNDLQTIVAWWGGRWPDANIGIACKPSGILVVDLDGGVDGEKELSELCQKLSIDEDLLYSGTYVVATGSGGLHLYFRWPGHVLASQASIAPHVDVRTNGGMYGGYVLGAGSVTSKGRYQSISGSQIIDAPPELVELVRDKPKPQPIRDSPLFRQPGHASYQGLIDAVRLCGEGNRNNMLLWASRAMCEDGADIEEAYRLLIPAYGECGGPGGERQARSTINSAYRLQGAKQ